MPRPGQHGGGCHRAISTVNGSFAAQPPRSAPRRGIGRGHAGGQPPGLVPPGDLPAAADTSPTCVGNDCNMPSARLTDGLRLSRRDRALLPHLGYLRCGGAYAIPTWNSQYGRPCTGTLVLGPEMHNGAEKSGDAGNDKNNGGTGPFALILRAIKSGLGRYWND
jgi:hypothetical protein